MSKSILFIINNRISANLTGDFGISCLGTCGRNYLADIIVHAVRLALGNAASATLLRRSAGGVKPIMTKHAGRRLFNQYLAANATMLSVRKSTLGTSSISALINYLGGYGAIIATIIIAGLCQWSAEKVSEDNHN